MNTALQRYRLFRLISHNNRLAFLRSPSFQQGLIAKVLMLIGGSFFVLYLLIYGTMFGSMAAGGDSFALLLGLMPIMLLIDFFIRFMVQQTPAMMLKPYMLLPLPRRSVVDTFLITSQLSIYNFLWLAMFIPYAIIILAGGCSFWLVLQLVIACQLMIIVNSQFYLVVRTLVGRSILWWLLPVMVYGLYFLPLLIDTKGDLFEDILDGIVDFGETPWLLPAVGLLYGLAYWGCRELQFAYAYDEVIAAEKTTTVKSVSSMSFFDSFGQTGEYLKLELKSIFRNKAIRARVISSLSLIVILSAIIAYTDIYDGRMMLNFWCFYCFALYGATALIKVMCPEGNYIDMLMTHRENILTLLRAKYYFHVAILFVPLLIMLPAVFEGKFSWLMMLAYFLMSSGLLYFLLFQLAVYNKQTLPLNQKITGKGNMENGLQLIIELVAFILPIALVSVLLVLFTETEAYLILAVIGFFFTLTHPLWLRQIYRRMMGRKYENLEGFHATR